ncbi:dihydrofolate reductase family protein [Agromyces soli]
MSRIVSFITTSLDGYVNDVDGRFDFATPSDEVHDFVNRHLAGARTEVYGRRLYETMKVWETWDVSGEPSPVREFSEFWKGIDKVVYSTTLESVETSRTRLERRFDAGELRAFADAAEHDVSIGGPTLLAEALRAGIVDELAFAIAPVVIGGGTKALPEGIHLDLELTEERRFENGTVFVSYRVRR